MTTEPRWAADAAYPPRRVLLLATPGFLAVQVLAVHTAVLVASTGPLPAGVIAGILAVLVGVGAGVVEWLALRSAFVPVRLEGDVLVVPRPLRGQRRVPLADISGLGMQYVAGGRASGWRPGVWLTGGQCLRLNIPPPNYPAPKGQRSRRRVRLGQPPPLNWQYVADSPAGRAQQQIGARVVAVQGPAGPWRVQQRETTSSRQDTLRTAFWSPSGAMGVLGRAGSGSGSGLEAGTGTGP